MRKLLHEKEQNLQGLLQLGALGGLHEYGALVNKARAQIEELRGKLNREASQGAKLLEIERETASNAANLDGITDKVASAAAQVEKAKNYLAAAEAEYDSLLLAQRECEELGEELQQKLSSLTQAIALENSRVAAKKARGNGKSCFRNWEFTFNC